MESEDVWEEVLNGKIIADKPHPSPDHYFTAENIFCIFKNFKRCIVILRGLGVHLTEKDIVIPDIVVLCDPNKLKNDGIHGAPDLIAEILSPGTAKRDKGYKKLLYERCGVKEYWIVDPYNHFIEVYLLTDGKYVQTGVYQKPDTFKTSLYDDLVIDANEVFEVNW